MQIQSVQRALSSGSTQVLNAREKKRRAQEKKKFQFILRALTRLEIKKIN